MTHFLKSNAKPFEFKVPLVKVLFYEDFFLTALDPDATFILEMCCICVEQVEKACIQLEKMCLKSNSSTVAHDIFFVINENAIICNGG